MISRFESSHVEGQSNNENFWYARIIYFHFPEEIHVNWIVLSKKALYGDPICRSTNGAILYHSFIGSLSGFSSTCKKEILLTNALATSSSPYDL